MSIAMNGLINTQRDIEVSERVVGNLQSQITTSTALGQPTGHLQDQLRNIQAKIGVLKTFLPYWVDQVKWGHEALAKIFSLSKGASA